MTKDELEQRINDLEERLFMIDMIDVWQREDRELYDKLSEELKEAKKQLEKLEIPKQKPQKPIVEHLY